MQLLRRRTPDVAAGPPYPVAVSPRDLAAEEPVTRLESFEGPEAVSINEARLNHLEWLELPLERRSVLDVGGGVGHLAQFFVRRDCRVVTTDAREENIAELRQRYPGHDGRVADVESDELLELGRFDVVFCYGLLYHLENPLRALRNFHHLTDDLLLVETIVCDSREPVLLLDDETLSYNQALRGVATRPSPSFVAMALNRVGFPFVYAPVEPPRHQDYEFEWRDDLSAWRDDHPLRAVFVASKRPVENARLLPLLGGSA